MSFVREFGVLVVELFCAQAPVSIAPPLASWNDGPAKEAIVKFVTDVSTQDAPTFVASSERIAVFDNDGTLWAEQPLYFQLMFVLDRIKAMAPQHPEWQRAEPFKSILAGSMKAALAGGDKAVAELIAATHAGMTTAEFETQVKDWLATAGHPRFNRPYTDLVYQPMVELLAYLRANGFKTYIVSGGGIQFMRPWTEQVYGIPPEQVIGSQGRLAFEMRGGAPVLVKLPQIDLVDDRAGKPIGIQKHIGRRPIATSPSALATHSDVGHAHGAAASNGSPNVASDLAAVRAATAKYHDVSAALADGYQLGYRGVVTHGTTYKQSARPKRTDFHTAAFIRPKLMLFDQHSVTRN